MKKILALLLFATSVLAQIPNRQVDIGNRETDFYTRLRLEGKGIFDKQLTYPSSFTAWPASPSSVTANGGPSSTTVANGPSTPVYMGQIQKFAGKAWWVESIDVNLISATNTPGDGILLNMVFQNGSSAGVRAFKYQAPIPLGRTSIPVRQWLSGNETITFSSISGLTTNDKIVFTAMPIAVEMTDCLDFTAQKIITLSGDSITESTNEGTLGTYTGDDTWPRKVWRYYADKGISVRYVNYGQAGQTADQAEQMRLEGRYSTIRKSSLVIYMEGINNVGGNSTATQSMRDAYTLNTTNYINDFLKTNSFGYLIMCGLSPVEGSTKHAVAEVYRSILQQVVAGFNNPRVIYVNLGNAFNRLDRQYYYAGEPTNNAVHPGVLGNQAMFDYLKAQVLTNINSLP